MVADLVEALELATKSVATTPASASSGGLWVSKKGGKKLGRDKLGQQLLGVGVAAAGLTGAVIVAERSTGCFSQSLKYANRFISKLLSQQMTVPLFTPEGQEPQPFKPHWDLPGQQRRSRKREQQSNVSNPGQVRNNSSVDDDEEDTDGDMEGSFESASLSAEMKPVESATTRSVQSRNPVYGAEREAGSEAMNRPSSSSTTGEESCGTSSDSLPHFFSSTKLLACLDLEESRELFESARVVRLSAEEVLFHCGDDSEGGTYIVVEGNLGVFLHDADGMADQNVTPCHTNTLQEGESVGDLDVVDGERRTVTCVALEEGAVLVEISRKLFMDFVTRKPRTLQVYLQQAIARLWRVAHFVLNDTLSIPQTHGKHACESFDIVPSSSIGLLDGELLGLLLEGQVGHYMCVPTGMSLYEENTPADAFYILLKGKMLLEKSKAGMQKGCTAEIVSPHCVIGSAAYFSSTARKQSVRALELCELVAIGVVELEKLRITNAQAFISLLVTAARAMGPLIREFISLGLNRVWLHAHDVAFRQGDPASSIYVTISGRLILAHEDHNTEKIQTEEIAGRGEAVGTIWSMSGGTYDTTAICTRDSELVRMSRGAFHCISTKYPAAAVKLLEVMAQRLGSARVDSNRQRLKSHPRKKVATVALIPINGQTRLCDQLASQLKQALEKFGPTLLLSGSKVGMAFPLVAERLSNRFYRSKLTAWMAAQEEDYSFIILQADPDTSDWSKICVAQADCVLLVASATSKSALSPLERKLVWRHMKTHAEIPLLSCRVELVLLHEDKGSCPSNTRYWLRERPRLERHHHMRKKNTKDVERLGRWLAGHAVGLVLSGGGSRGLAHLGVLRALEDAGVPIDVVGGTSQGAFMAALFAQRLTWDRMFSCVQEYAHNLGSIRGLLSDLTLPIVSLFNGTGFTRLVARCLKHGPTRIEDLWLRSFCVCTNLTKGEPSVHEHGPLAHLVRASMTVVGLLPPVYNEGDLLVDGCYLNNIPVDVMRTQMGVDRLIVVDVEDKDFCTWNSMTAYGEGLSGWLLLWDSLKALVVKTKRRFPKHGELINSLLFLSHKQQLRSVMRDYHIDLYMRPTGVQYFRLMDYHLMDRIVRDAYRYGWTAISEWQCNLAAEQSSNESGDLDQTKSRPLMMLRTRSITRVHSHDFVRKMQSTAHLLGMQETSVERIQVALAERKQRRRSAGGSADQLYLSSSEVDTEESPRGAESPGGSRKAVTFLGGESRTNSHRRTASDSGVEVPRITSPSSSIRLYSRLRSNSSETNSSKSSKSYQASLEQQPQQPQKSPENGQEEVTL